MISNFKQIEKLWKELDTYTNKTINFYVIGGAVLVHQELKAATKDIDLIISTKESYESLCNILKTRGFEQKNPTGVYESMFISGIFERRDVRLDLFLETVCKKLHLSSEMMKRAQQSFSGKYLQVYHCANEDIFLFKSMTDREGDLEDNITLAKTGLNWKYIMTEIKDQINQYGTDVWITWIGERFDLLEEKGIQIPIMNEIDQLRNSYFDKIEKDYHNEI